MASISIYLQKIKSAIYGEEVRDSIHDAIDAMNAESSNAMEYAKTAKDSAAAAASTASTKAAEAATSAQTAKASETNAKKSETNAASKANEAVSAASGAKASETAAANSMTVAMQKAQEAANSQVAAVSSEAEAKATESRIKTIQSNVETLSVQITSDKNATETARDNALASQNAAKTSESIILAAQTAAESAKNSAEAASIVAQNAKTSAQASADSASKDANDAITAAENAAASAVSAQCYSGKPPMPQDGHWWIWDASLNKYTDSGIGCELTGLPGNGIADIQLTRGDHSPGSTDIYTVTMTDGSTMTVSVYNGRNGTGTGDVLGVSFDLMLPASGWSDGALTLSDERFLALSNHKYLVDVYEIDREVYLDCNVRPRDISTTGFITFVNDSDPLVDITVNIVRLELSANAETE